MDGSIGNSTEWLRKRCAVEGCTRPVRTRPHGGVVKYCSPEHARLADRAQHRMRYRGHYVPVRRFLDIEEVRALAARGMTSHEIARETGFSVSTVQDRARDEGIKIAVRRRYVLVGAARTSDFWRAHDETISLLYDEGNTLSAIAAAIGVTKGAVAGRLNRLDRIGERKPQPITSPRRIIEFPPYGHCLFPYGDPPDADFRFCGEPVEHIGESWCDRHYEVTHLKRELAPLEVLAGVALKS